MCDHSYQYDEIVESSLALQMILTIITKSNWTPMLICGYKVRCAAAACDTLEWYCILFQLVTLVVLESVSARF